MCDLPVCVCLSEGHINPFRADTINDIDLEVTNLGSASGCPQKHSDQIC